MYHWRQIDVFKSIVKYCKNRVLTVTRLFIVQVYVLFLKVLYPGGDETSKANYTLDV